MDCEWGVHHLIAQTPLPAVFVADSSASRMQRGVPREGAVEQFVSRHAEVASHIMLEHVCEQLYVSSCWQRYSDLMSPF